MNLTKYEFSAPWFWEGPVEQWAQIIPLFEPKRYLEIGSYEGSSACWMIEQTDVELVVCIDSWRGGIEHQKAGADMQVIEQRFDSNVSIAGDAVDRVVELTKLKQSSHSALIELISSDLADSFDIVYVDGSHEPKDVLADAVLAFMLLRPGGLMIFDDYRWFDQNSERGIASSPKMAIDAFVNCYFEQLGILKAQLDQFYCVKKFASTA